MSLEKFGIEVFILAPFERSFDISKKIHVIPLNNILSNFNAPYKMLRYFYYNKIFSVLFSGGTLGNGYLMKSFLRKIMDFLLKKKIDLIQTEQDVAASAGILLKKATGLPLLVDLHNISAEELVAARVIERKSKVFSKLQSRTQELLKDSDHIIVVSELMRDYVIDNYNLPIDLVTVIPPGGRILTDESRIKRRAKPFKVAYAGLVTYREHVDLFVKSMTFVKGLSNVHFYITNKGEALKEIKKIAKKHRVNPNFFWFRDYETLNSFLSSCHIGVLPSSYDVARRMGIPVKLFNYMSLGLPVIANDIGGWSRIIEEEEIGLLTDDDPVDFASAISKLIDDEDLRIKMSYNALEAVKNKYNWDISAERLVKVYEAFS